MSNEVRFQRMEDKIDSVKEDVTEVKIEVNEIKSDIKHHMKKVESHVAGDNKIINELQPILNKLPHIVEMAEEYHISKQMKKRVMKYVGVFATVLGIFGGLVKVGIITL